jgi:hypothetical protein
MLRPYQGLHQEVLDDVLDALRARADALTEPRLDRHLVTALWAIQHFGRAWALEPDGMLRRNRLISEPGNSDEAFP